MPVRSGSDLPSPWPASCSANWAAATPIWHSRHITFSPLRIAFFCSFSKGPKSSISPENCLASAATCTAVASGGTAESGLTPLRPRGERFPKGFLGAPQGTDGPNARDDDPTLRGTHESSDGMPAARPAGTAHFIASKGGRRGRSAHPLAVKLIDRRSKWDLQCPGVGA